MNHIELPASITRYKRSLGFLEKWHKGDLVKAEDAASFITHQKVHISSLVATVKNSTETIAELEALKEKADKRELELCTYTRILGKTLRQETAEHTKHMMATWVLGIATGVTVTILWVPN